MLLLIRTPQSTTLTVQPLFVRLWIETSMDLRLTPEISGVYSFERYRSVL